MLPDPFYIGIIVIWKNFKSTKMLNTFILLRGVYLGMLKGILLTWCFNDYAVLGLKLGFITFTHISVTCPEHIGRKKSWGQDKATTSGAQVSLLALFLGINSGGVQGTLCSARNGAHVSCTQDKSLTHCTISLATHLFFPYRFTNYCQYFWGVIYQRVNTEPHR